MINSRDISHNNRSNVLGEDDNWEVVAHSQEDLNVFYVGWSTANPTSPGQYYAYLKPEKTGRFKLSVTLNGVHAKGSPFELYVRPNIAYGATSHLVTDVTSSGFVNPVVNGGNTFVVQLADETGNKLATTAYPYSPGELRKRASLMLGGAKLTLLIIIYSIRSLGDDVCDERRGDQHRGGRQRVNRAEWRRNDHGDPQPNRQVS
tara:strand:+ start:208 stop:819 length:612 start_codon:yes stop_codon:yes gene_type:complete